jgi:hypothetical protein
VLKSLRIAAKDVGKLRQSNDALKLEIEKLKADAAADNLRLKLEMEHQMQEKASLAKNHEIELLKFELQEALKLLDTERKLRIASEENVSVIDNKRHATEQALTDSESKLFKCEEALRSANKRILSLELSINKKKEVQSFPLQPTFLNSSSSDRNSPNQTTKVALSVESPSALIKLNEELKKEQEQGYLLKLECKKMVDTLEKEAATRRVLEEELNRLRKISIEFKMKLESHPKNSNDQLYIQSLPTNSSSDTSLRKSDEIVARNGLLVQEGKKLQEMHSKRNNSLTSVPNNNGFQQSIPSRKPSLNGNYVQKIFNPQSEKKSDENLEQSEKKTKEVQQTELAAALNTFEKNLDSFRSKMKQVISL